MRARLERERASEALDAGDATKFASWREAARAEEGYARFLEREPLRSSHGGGP